MEKNLESEAKYTGFWVSDGYFCGPIKSMTFFLTRDRKIMHGQQNTDYKVDIKGKILNPEGKDTGYFFDDSLNIYGPEYGTLPWMNEKAERLPPREDTPEDYGMKIQ